MKIAVSCHPTQGGSGIVAVELGMAMMERGHEVHVISSERPYRLPAESDACYHKVYIPDYPLFRYPPHDLSLINQLAEVVRKYDIDIIHAHYAVPHAICGIFAKHVVQPHPVRVIATMHGTDITLVGSHPDFMGLCRFAMNQCDALTVVSNWLQDRTMEEFDLDQRPVVIHNFYDNRRFHAGNRTPYPGENQEFVLTHAGNFRPVKRIGDIIHVFHEVQKVLPARLKLVGDGPELGMARELAAELRICRKVDFLGSVQDIETVFRGSHLYLLLSDYESFGLSALEAMACGVPVAASRSGGLTEVVEDMKTGMLTTVGDISGTTQKVLALLRNRQAWEAMSRNSASLAAARFSSPVIVDQYESLYDQVMAHGKPDRQ